MATETLQQRFRRLLLLVPFVIRNPDAGVDEVCTRFGISRRQLAQDLELLFVCGRPGYGPDNLIEAFIDGDRVHIRMAEYFAKPLRLTHAEGLVLYAGAKALLAAGAGDEALERALKRLQQALGEEALERVRLEFEEPGPLEDVRSGLQGQRRLHLVYQSHSKDEVTERDVDPWALFVSGGRWYLVGWCHRVSDERVFRVDRMQSVTVLDEPVRAPDDVDLSKYEDLYFESPASTKVVLDLAPEAAAWVSDYYPLDSQQRLKGGWVRIHLSVGGLAWLEKLLLRLGGQARVVEPQSLADSVRELACRLLHRYL